MASGEVQWDNLNPPTGDIVDTTDLAGLQPTDEGGSRRLKRIAASLVKAYVLKPLVDATFAFLNGIQLSSNRIAFQEKRNKTLQVGWNTIGYIPSGAVGFAYGEVNILSNLGRGGGCFYGLRTANNARTHQNSAIKLKPWIYDTALLGINSFRWAKDDSSQITGAKLQVYSANVRTVDIQNIGNFSADGKPGLILVDPVLENTPTLPDGVTVGTFLEAGEERRISGSITTFATGWTGRYVSNDQLRCSIDWPEIPTQGTALTITLPTTLRVYTGAGTFGTISVAHTISNFSVRNRQIEFAINETGAFGGLNAGALAFYVSGSDCVLKII